MQKACKNTFYSSKEHGAVLYIDEDFRVGFGYSKEQAKRTCGLHNHWIKGDGALSSIWAVSSPIHLENK